MQWPTLTQDEQQELWNTLEVLMHGATAAEVRCAQQRLETMTSRQRPYLAPSVGTLLDQLVQAAVCASQGGEQRFYWLDEVENRWKALLDSLQHTKSPGAHLGRSTNAAALAAVLQPSD